jgi:hypothetical protein
VTDIEVWEVVENTNSIIEKILECKDDQKLDQLLNTCSSKPSSKKSKLQKSKIVPAQRKVE